MAHLRSFFDTEIPVYVPKVSAEIKEKDGKSISYLIKYSRQLGLHVYLFYAQNNLFIYDLEYIHMRRNELQTGMKTSSVHMTFHFRCISKQYFDGHA